MINDAYAEWLVRRKVPFYAYVAEAVMAVLLLFSAFLALSTVLGVVVLTLVGVATYLVFRNARVEFEYVYVDGQLTVDKILGRSKRKKAWEGEMEDIQMIAPKDSYVLKDYEKPDMKTLDFTSQMPDRRVYALICQNKGAATRVLFEPNDKMLQCFRQKSPRKVVLS